MLLVIKLLAIFIIVGMSYRYVFRNTNGMEATTIFFFSTCITLQLYKLIFLNTKWYKVKQDILSVIINDIDRVLILPYFSLLLFVLIKKGMTIKSKFGVYICWLTILPLLEFVNKSFHYVEFKNWGIGMSYLQSFILLGFHILFFRWYQCLGRGIRT
jgi:hypothetical protein